MKREIGRRQFLITSTQAGTGLVLTAGLGKSSQAFAASDTIRVAIVGLRSRGGAHIQGFHEQAGVEIVALCDVDENVLSQRANQLEKLSGRKVKRVRDMRELFDDKSIDVVSFATPNHWHSLGGIWAMQAGKHTYIEKPCSHNLWEGRQLVKAARQYNRLCQHGTQGRSAPAVQEAMLKLREGAIGEIYMARGLCFKWRPSIGKVDGPQPIPPGIDYDLWLGPALKKPLMRKQLHYDWHWQWDYGCGDMGNQGVHEMDMARWALGVGLPSKIQAAGGHFMFVDDQETPNSLVCTFEYPKEKKVLQFETRHWISNYEGNFGEKGQNDVGVLVFGSEGYMELEYFGYRIFLGKKREPGPTGKSGDRPWASFITALRNGKVSDLAPDIEEGHLSSALCHLGNIAYRTGRTIHFDPVTELIQDDPEASALLTRPYRDPFVVTAVS